MQAFKKDIFKDQWKKKKKCVKNHGAGV